MRPGHTVREMSLASPLLDFDDLLFVKRAPGSFTHMSDQYYGWWSRPGGGLYILRDFKSESRRLQCLTEHLEPGSFLRPDLSHNGRRVLFAYCRHYPDLHNEPDKLDKGQGTGRRVLPPLRDEPGRHRPEAVDVRQVRRFRRAVSTERRNRVPVDASRPRSSVRGRGT